MSVIEGDCLAILPTIPAESIDLIFADPPYNIGKAAWDKVPDYLNWCSCWIAECSRALKPNGAFWISHSKPLVLAKLSEMVTGHGRGCRNWITWWKHNGECEVSKGAFASGLDQNRSWFPNCEYLIFHADEGDWATACNTLWSGEFDQRRGFIFEPLRAYLEGERKRAGVDKADCNVACGFSHSAGGMASRHYFSRSQWCLPTQEHYESLRNLFNTQGGDFLRREYDDLRREYEELHRGYGAIRSDYESKRREFEHLRYTFNNPGKMSSVWQIPPAKPNGHATPKPEELMRRIIEATSNPGDTVLDPFGGSGTTAAVAAMLGRKFITIEQNAKYCDRIQQRIRAASSPLINHA